MPDHPTSSDTRPPAARPQPDAGSTAETPVVPSPAAHDHRPPDGGRCVVARRYDYRRFHKKGGMGRVFVFADEAGRDVAVKDIQPAKFCRSADELFEFEAAVTADLEHPGVVPVYGCGRGTDGRPFYAMRFVDGPTLTDAIKAFHDTFPADRSRLSLTGDQVLELRQLLTRFVAVCQTVGYAHSKGVIHRDLKPANVLLGPFGETLVIDWGLAKRMLPAAPAVDADGDQESVGPDDDVWEKVREVKGRGSGTPGYWAHEQAANQLHKHDARTDVYALGAVLYHVLVGVSPHPTGNHPDDPPSPKDEVGWVDDELDGLVRKCLSEKRRDRFQSATDLATAVERWLADQPVAAQRSKTANLQRMRAADPTNVPVAELLARQLVNLGLVLTGMGRSAEALATLTDAIKVFEELHARRREKDGLRFQAEIANAQIAAAQALDHLGRPQDATERYRLAIDLYRGLFGDFPQDVPIILKTITNLPDSVAAIHLTPAGSADPYQMLDYPPAVVPLEETDIGTPVRAPVPLPETHFALPDVPAPPWLTKEKPADSRPPVMPRRTGGEYASGDALLGEYKLIEKIGRGEFTQVWKAVDPSGKRVAVKVVDLTRGAVAAKELKAYRLVKNLEHPHLLPLFTARLIDAHDRPVEFDDAEASLARRELRELVIVMGMAEQSLADRLKELNPNDPPADFRVGLPVGELIGYMQGAAKGIDFLNQPTHNLGETDWPVIHCDIKPGNLFLASGEVRVGDFDMAMLVTNDPRRRTRAGGTFAYSPPELLANKPGPGTDQYSLAVCYYELRTGRLPFPDKIMPYDLMQLHVTGQLDFSSPTLATAERTILRRATALQPAARYPSCVQFVRAVERAVDHLLDRPDEGDPSAG